MEPGKLLDDPLGRLSQVIRGEGSVLDAFGSPEQKEIIDRVTGVMSLLEGHADVVMDGVGPSVIPTVGDIRRKFDRRRRGVGSLDRLLRRLLGLDKVGMHEFNAVWESPANLPSRAEIADPSAWVGRVL
jgi:uncharacterized protein (DUF2342 family)